ncbi:Rho guanine nucleotide exchange factor 35 [Sorochytrium milnesiophthora]
MQLALFVALLLASVLPALQQSADVMSGNCVQIQPDWQFCGGLHGMYLDTQADPKASVAGLMMSRAPGDQSLPWSSVFKKNMGAFLDVRTVLMPNNVNVTYSAAFSKMYNCPAYTHYHRRYLMSMWCVDMVSSSLKSCPGAANFKPLCRDTCEIYAQTSAQTLHNSTQCPGSADSTPARQQGITNFNNFCSSAIFNGQPGNCTSGNDVEAGTCGYLIQEQVCNPAACPNPNPSLCPNLASTDPSGSSSGSGSAAGTGSANGTVANGASAGQQAATSSGSTGVLAPVVIACVLIVVFVGVIMFYVYRRKKNNRGMDTASNEDSREGSRYQPGQSEYNNYPVAAAAAAAPTMEMSMPRSTESENRYVPMSPTSPKSPLQQQQQWAAADLRNDMAPGSMLPTSPQQQQSFTMAQAPFVVAEKASNMPKANKRQSSLIVDKNMTLEDMLEASLGAERALGNGAPPALTENADGTLNRSTLAREHGAKASQFGVDRAYRPVLSDELELLVGDVLSITQVYDDGWAYGMNLSTGQLGVLPVSFVVECEYRDPMTIPFRDGEYSDSARLQTFHAQLLRQQQKQQEPLPAPPGQQQPPMSPTAVQHHPPRSPTNPADVSYGSNSRLLNRAQDAEPEEHDVQRARVSVTAAKHSFRETTYGGDDEDYDMTINRSGPASPTMANHSLRDEAAERAAVHAAAAAEPAPAAATGPNEAMSITALMEILSRIAHTDRESRIFNPQHHNNIDMLAQKKPEQIMQDPNAMQALTDARLSLQRHLRTSMRMSQGGMLPPQLALPSDNDQSGARDSTTPQHMSGRDSLFYALGLNPNEFDDEEDEQHHHLPADDNQSETSSHRRRTNDDMTKRFSFSALMHLLDGQAVDPEHAYDDDEDADDTGFRPRHSGAGSHYSYSDDPTTAANTYLNSTTLGMPPTTQPHASKQPSPLSRVQNTDSLYGQYPRESVVTTASARPYSTLSDLDRLEDMLNQEEELLKQLRSK